MSFSNANSTSNITDAVAILVPFHCAEWNEDYNFLYTLYKLIVGTVGSEHVSSSYYIFNELRNNKLYFCLRKGIHTHVYTKTFS